MLFNSIGLETRYESFKSLESLFEGQLKVVKNTSTEKKVFEKRGTRCLIVTAYDFKLVKINEDSNGTEDYNSDNFDNVSPFQITDGLTLSASDSGWNPLNSNVAYFYNVAYFKVDD